MNFQVPETPRTWGRLRSWGPYIFTVLVVLIVVPIIAGVSDAQNQAKTEICKNARVMQRFIESEMNLRQKEAEESRNVATFWSGLAFEIKDARLTRFINSDADTRQQQADDADAAVTVWAKLTKGLACR